MSLEDHKFKIVDWGMQDVAVKVLTDQDVGEAQLKEFLREVSLHFYWHQTSNFSRLNKNQNLTVPIWLPDCYYETSPPSECGIVHGCGDKMPAFVNSDRVFAQVNFPPISFVRLVPKIWTSLSKYEPCWCKQREPLPPHQQGC